MSSHPERKILTAWTLLLSSVLGTAAGGADDLDDEAMESFLLDAEVVRVQQMLPGSTHPMAIDLNLYGTTRRAAYKYRPADLPHTGDIAKDQPLPDSYLYEAAAYRLDRALDLRMVPVAVIREVHAEGSVIEWIENAVSVKDLRERKGYPGDPESLADQQEVMRLFDALILNLDRKPSDQLVTPADGKLHLLDHSRSFQLSTELPQAFLERPVSLPRALLPRLARLESESLSQLLEGLVTDSQIEAMLHRRDIILVKIGVDREKYGDAEVFQD